MDEWDEDAYVVIYDEREKPRKTDVAQNRPCCGILPVFIIVGVILTVLI